MKTVRIIQGFSTPNAISLIDSEKHCGVASRNENGSITVSKKLEVANMKDLTGIFNILYQSFIIALVVKLLMAEGFFGSIPKMAEETLMVMPFLIYAVTIIGFMVYNMIKEPELLRMHGAEHKVIRAFNKYGRMPTIEEARASGRITKYCGTVKSTEPLIWEALSILYYYYSGGVIFPELIVILLMTFGRINFFPCNVFGLVLQWALATREPGEQELEVALAAVKELLRE